MNWISGLSLSGLLLLATAPTSTNYSLNAYDLGSGGGTSSSTNYGIDASTGTQAGASSSANYATQSGLMPTQDANVPPAGTLTNPDNYYNKLHFVVNQGNNPSDAKYAIAVSIDGFVSTQYVQNDNSVSSTIGIEDFQSYVAWGGAGGFDILGLASNTNYQVRVSAMQGNMTQSAYGPATPNVATVLPSLSFGVSTSLTGTPPFTAGFSDLVPGSVVSANADPIISLSTNSVNGGIVYVRSANAGLASVASSSMLPSATADLGSTKGYGAQVISTSQVSGGPFTSLAPYASAANSVGGVGLALAPILSSSGPIGGGSATVRLKAKTDITVPSSTDYTDTITFVASMLY